MKRLLATLSLVLTLAPGFSMAQEPEAGVSLSDIDENSSYAIAVPYVVSKGYMKGFPDGTFRPDATVKRSEVVLALTAAAEIEVPDEDDAMTQVFKDVRRSNKAFGAVFAASQRDVFADLGLKKNVFRPLSRVTAGQALNMLYRAYKTPTNPSEPTPLRYELKTVLPDDYTFTPDVRRAVAEKILMQRTDGTLTLDVTAPLSRGEFAKLLYRFIETRTPNTAFGYASWYGDGLSKMKVESERAKALHGQFLTAAHRDLPIGTILKVSNEKNGSSVEVVVNDRGPYVAGRIIDLSRSAFAAIESPGAGTVMVKIEVVE